MNKTANQIRENITALMVDALAKGLPPWRRAWSTNSNTGAPCNFASGRRYSGINPLLLMWSSLVQGFESKHWGSDLTWLRNVGGVINDELPTAITLFRFINKVENGKVVRNSKGEPIKVPLLREFYVYNIAQVKAPSVDELMDGRSPNIERMLGRKTKSRRTSGAEMLEIAERYLGKRATAELTRRRVSIIASNVANGIDAKLDRYRALPCTQNTEPDFKPAEDFLSNTGAKTIHRGDRAIYREQTDTIMLPPKRTFASMADYYETRFHEMIHWGIRRVKSVQKAIKDSKRPYAFEELIAEIGACFLIMEIGVPMSDQMLEQSQSYVKTWLGHMESDPKYIFDAASHASKVVDHLLGFVVRTPVSGLTEHELAA